MCLITPSGFNASVESPRSLPAGGACLRLSFIADDISIHYRILPRSDKTEQSRVAYPLRFFVRSHDILYRLSQDILYTPARAMRSGATTMAWKSVDIHGQRVRFVVTARQS